MPIRDAPTPLFRACYQCSMQAGRMGSEGDTGACSSSHLFIEPHRSLALLLGRPCACCSVPVIGASPRGRVIQEETRVLTFVSCILVCGVGGHLCRYCSGRGECVLGKLMPG